MTDLLTGAEGQGVFLVDGVDIATLGFGVADLSDWWSGVALDRNAASPYATLHASPANDGTVAPVVWTPRLVWAGERDQRPGALDALRRLLPRGARVEIRVGDSDRVGYGFREADVVEVLVPAQWEYGDVVARVPITMYDPALYDAEETEIALSDTPAVVALGTLPSDWRVVLPGPRVDPEVVVSEVVESAVGDTLYTLALEVEVEEGEDLHVDFAAHTITVVPDEGESEDALDALPLGATGLRLLGGPGGAASVAVHVTGGDGTLHYRRRWG